MSRLGKRVIAAADETLAIARGQADPATRRVRELAELMEERKRRRAALHAALERGIADIHAGHVQDADTLFAEIEDGYARMVRRSGRKAKRQDG
jgi:antitoxin ParD1/3/4